MHCIKKPFLTSLWRCWNTYISCLSSHEIMAAWHVYLTLLYPTYTRLLFGIIRCLTREIGNGLVVASFFTISAWQHHVFGIVLFSTFRKTTVFIVCVCVELFDSLQGTPSILNMLEIFDHVTYQILSQVVHGWDLSWGAAIFSSQRVLFLLDVCVWIFHFRSRKR